MQSHFTHLLPFFPADPQVSSGKETSHSMSGQVVDPTLLPQLSHDGIDERETSPSLKGHTEYPGTQVSYNGNLKRQFFLFKNVNDSVPLSMQPNTRGLCPNPPGYIQGCPPSC